MDPAGNLYGTVAAGGPYGAGEVFELVPDANKAKWQKTVVYSFCALGKNCPDGASPAAGVILDGAGNLYGTTESGGGKNNAGVVYELTPNDAGSEWTEHVVHRFCAQGGSCSDGHGPLYSGVVMDGTGHLYGTTEFGGNTYNAGVIFQLTPNADKSSWKETVLYTFCSQAGCIDGQRPLAGVIMDGLGSLYGTTNLAGSGWGNIFELTSGAGTWTETSLYNFCSLVSCDDGENPESGLLMDGSGNLYGTTPAGGPDSGGVAYELIPNLQRTAWTQQTLYNFCAQSGCIDGKGPQAGLIMDGKGNLYGTTRSGGAAQYTGAIFELTPGPPPALATETIIHSFCEQGGICADGELPSAGLIRDRNGVLYGTTQFGGSANNAGVVFALKR